jgi:hypothetical protein
MCGRRTWCLSTHILTLLTLSSLAVGTPLVLAPPATELNYDGSPCSVHPAQPGVRALLDEIQQLKRQLNGVSGQLSATLNALAAQAAGGGATREPSTERPVLGQITVSGSGMVT